MKVKDIRNLIEDLEGEDELAFINNAVRVLRDGAVLEEEEKEEEEEYTYVPTTLTKEQKLKHKQDFCKFELKSNQYNFEIDCTIDDLAGDEPIAKRLRKELGMSESQWQEEHGAYEHFKEVWVDLAFEVQEHLHDQIKKLKYVKKS